MFGRINFLQLLFVSLMVIGAVFADVKPDVSQSESLQEALDDLKAASFHDALHALSAKFRHGIFPTDLHAAEALQDEEPTIASLIKLAKRDNVTSSPEATSIPAATSVAEPTSEATTSLEPTSAETSVTSVPTTAKPTSEATTSAEPTSVPQTTTAKPTSETSTEKTTQPTTSAQSTTSEHTTTSATTSEHTTTEKTTASVPATTQATTQHTTTAPTTLSTATSSSSSSTSSRETTSHSSEHSSQTSLTTSTFERTSTRADGSFTTLTSVTVITPAAATKGSSETNGAKPGLQTGNAAAPTAGVAREVAAMFGGAMMVAMAL